MQHNNHIVQAHWEQICRRGSYFHPVAFESDNVGAINPRLTLAEIQVALEEVCKYLGYSLSFEDKLLTQKYISFSLRTEDPEQLYYALNMLVDRGIINYNPATIDGVLFGRESWREWQEFGGRIYPGVKTRTWSLSYHKDGMQGWRNYWF
jgi:hypothetical protein